MHFTETASKDRVMSSSPQFSQINDARIFLSPPDVGPTEKALMNEAFDSNWIAPLGPFVERFERMLSEQMNGRPVVALSSGTAAIHLALIRLGVGPGDHVLVQSFTFCATANPVKYLGAEPIFIGSESETWNMCPHSLELAIMASIAKGKLPKAIIPVHLYGVPAKVSELQSIAAKYGIPILEDAAESLGAKFNGRQTGTFGAFGVLSFNGNKIITTSGGGALVCSDQREYIAIKHLATQAREQAPYYLHQQIGFNYRLSNISAAIGVGQMLQLTKKIERRREIHQSYSSELADLMNFPAPKNENFENRWLTVATLTDEIRRSISALQLVEKMEQSNIECRPLWKPLHTQPIFSGASYFGENLETQLFERGVCLPSGSSLTHGEQNRVISAIREVMLGQK